MKTPLVSLGLLLVGVSATCLAATEGKDTRCFEMRIYHAAPGKFDELHARFRNHAVRLFVKHGITNLGYWVPVDEKDGSTNTLIYLLGYPNREARERAWKEFMADPDWKEAFKASEVNGTLVAKFEQKFLVATDYSPEIKPGVAAAPRVFELRTYTASAGNLGNLHARFRDHTLKLFAKHGLTSFGYWTLAEGQAGADNTLIYLLAHPSREAANAAFTAFGADPEWQAAKKASEDKAGGSLTAPGGVKSVFLKATDYSPIK
jgi:hypothetical protein